MVIGPPASIPPTKLAELLLSVLLESVSVPLFPMPPPELKAKLPLIVLSVIVNIALPALAPLKMPPPKPDSKPIVLFPLTVLR